LCQLSSRLIYLLAEDPGIVPLEHIEYCDLCGSDRLREFDTRVNISECTTCGYIFDNPRPSIGDIIEYYSSAGKYDSWLDELEGRELLWKRRLSEVTKFVDGGRLLDVGAGIGQFLFHARQQFEVDGTEVSDEAIKVARDHFGIDLSRGTIEQIGDFQAGSYDAITLFHVLEHVPSPSVTIRKCDELLKEGGFLFIAVPNDRYAFWRHGGIPKYCVKKILSYTGVEKYRKLIRFDKIVLDPEIQTEIHLSHFTPPALKSFLTRAGFDILKHTLDPYYSVTGFERLKEDLRFTFHRLIYVIFSINLYETIWIVARRRDGVVGTL
jgi:2-polyprenyl-3-methyl-5-hydroxy-6-metoxy-1,4-benzoquinol methylase